MTCKTNKQFAFNTKMTKEYFKANNIVAFEADRDKDPAVDQLLLKLGNSAKAIPYYAVYTPGSDEPFHFQAFYTTGPGAFIDQIKGEVELASKNREIQTAKLE